MKFNVLEVLTGRKQVYRDADEYSAIGKMPVSGRVNVGTLGLEGDEQADLAVHGGPDKAIHHYPFDHYAAWKDAIGSHALLQQPGGFGENISTAGLTEDQVCIGDRFRLGTALVEVSQGRQPCWKLDHRFDGLNMSAMVVATRRSGWYYRVIEAGTVGAGDALELLDRPFDGWIVRRVFGLLIAGDAKRDPDALQALKAVPVLSDSWKTRLDGFLNA